MSHKGKTHNDRNFDDLAERFERKINGGLKGTIRLEVLWRNIQLTIDQLTQRFEGPLRILDLGADLSQLSLRLAQQGHGVVINDISTAMLESPKQISKSSAIKSSPRLRTYNHRKLPRATHCQPA